MALKFSIGYLLMFFTSLAVAQSTNTSSTVSSTGAGGEMQIPSVTNLSRSSSDYLIVRLQNSCFGTNLRSVTNPLSPNSLVKASFDLVAAGQKMSIEVTYPGVVAAPKGLTQKNPGRILPKYYKLPEKSRVAIFGNTVQIEIPFKFSSSITKSLKTNEQIAIDTISTSNVKFEQTVSCDGEKTSFSEFGFSDFANPYQCGQYMGATGPLSFQLAPPVVASDNSAVEIPVSFPGQNGFCGGYFSPLMVFFDQQRPEFSAVSDFPINPGSQTAWPEKNNTAAFLVIDRSRQGKITEKDQLFTDTDKFKNGFDKLAELDADKNMILDKKDKDFKNLYLWTDTNSNGISEPKELEPVGKRIKSISLQYQKGHLESIGQTAQIREISEVTLLNNKKITIADIWLAPIAKPKNKGQN